jgi:hypothetical protein
VANVGDASIAAADALETVEVCQLAECVASSPSYLSLNAAAKPVGNTGSEITNTQSLGTSPHEGGGLDLWWGPMKVFDARLS